MIEIQHLEKRYSNGFTPLTDVNTVINNGEVITLIGPSGTGKSTLLRCINLLDPPTGGKILIDGEDITAEGTDISKVSRKVGMVFQGFYLFSHLTAIENIMISPMKLKGVSKQDAYETGIELLDNLWLKDKALYYPANLSGGQKQRVAIARTLAMDPDIILFDEPTSALDPKTIELVKAAISKLSKAGKTMLIVTHDINLAKAISTRVFYMDQGVIYEDGTPEEIFNNPKHELTRNFIKTINTLEINFDENTELDDAHNEIYIYCRNRLMNTSDILNLQLIFEELFINVLRNALGEKVTGKAELSYDVASGSSTFVFYYKGDEVDLSDDEALAIKLIKNKAKTISQSTDGEFNTIKMIV